MSPYDTVRQKQVMSWSTLSRGLMQKEAGLWKNLRGKGLKEMDDLLVGLKENLNTTETAVGSSRAKVETFRNQITDLGTPHFARNPFKANDLRKAKKGLAAEEKSLEEALNVNAAAEAKVVEQQGLVDKFKKDITVARLGTGAVVTGVGAAGVVGAPRLLKAIRERRARKQGMGVG